ncbi:MAG: GHKL domain-containing protein [Lachnospiraceae bacterium]|nr:GHKL domain-containing protein [Lachnospiraceae bacterium]
MSMDEMWGIANTISVIVGLLISGVLVARFYNPFVIKKMSAILIGAVFFATMTILYLIPLPMSGDIAYIIGVVILCAVSVLSDRRNVPQKIFLSVTVYMFFWISDAVSALPWTLISDLTYLREESDMNKQFILFVVALIMLVLIENVLLLLETLIFKKIYKRKREQMQWRELSLIVSPYVAIIIGYWICSFLSDAYADAIGEYIRSSYPVYDVVRALFGIIAFVASITVVYSYQEIKRHEEDAMQSVLVSKQMEELSEHVHTMEKVYSDVRSVRHDINNHIMILGNLLEKSENDEAIRYLNEWQRGFPVPELNARTGNPVTDIVISEKMREGREVGIEFVSDFHYPDSTKVESIDIGIILSNALSNAIRAASSSDNSKIEVSAWTNNNAYLIQVKNTFAGKLCIDTETGLTETTKRDKERHGYGLLNMKRITEKYYGTIKLEQDNDIVIFTAMLILPE